MLTYWRSLLPDAGLEGGATAGGTGQHCMVITCHWLPVPPYMLEWALHRADTAALGGHLFWALAMRLQGASLSEAALDEGA